MEQSLWFLHKYIGEAAEKGEHLDHVLVPILQHVHDFLHSFPSLLISIKSFLYACAIYNIGNLEMG